MNLLQDKKAALEAQLRRDGGKIAPMPDGPIIEIARSLELAQALESEIQRAGSMGHTKIRIDMNLEDAAELARIFRRAHIMGV